MNQHGIRSKLVLYFLSLLSAILIMNVLFVTTHSIIINHYQEIGQNIINQNELINITKRLVLQYNVYRNAPLPHNLEEYNKEKELLNETFDRLDDSVVQEDSRIELQAVRNTIANVLAETDQGIMRLEEGSIEDTSLYYFEANRKLDFVEENVANLLLKEINHSAELQSVAGRINRLVVVFGSILFALVFSAAIVASIRWSKQIVSPLLKLDATAKKISEGNLDANVEESLLKEQDEIGSLSQSLNIMIGHLRTNMQEIAKGKDSAENLVILRTKELQDEHSRLLASINSLSLGFLIVTKDAQVFLKNKAISELLGFSPTEKISIDDISKKLGNFDIRKQAQQCLQDNKVCEIKEITFDKKILRGLIAPIAASQNGDDILGYALVIEDVTEVKVVERSREEFFAVASHELRTPLTAIRGNMEMLKDFGSQIPEKEKNEMINDALEGSTRLIAIVNDFLDVSRLEQNKIILDKQPFDIVAIIEQQVRELEPVAHKKGLWLTFKKPETSTPLVLADSNRTKQIIVNLLGNAVNYTEHGSITIALKASDTQVAVTVTDTGKGISPENQSLLFRKFQQAGEKILTRDSSKGTGLGLYISRLLVEAMGGNIELIQSTPGQGTTFEFTLPLASPSQK